MNNRLLFADREFDPAGPLPANTADLTLDLALDALLAAMAGGDRFLVDTARRVLLTPLGDAPAVRYRQNVLADCIRNPAAVREMYAIAQEAVDRERHEWLFVVDRPESVLNRSLSVLGIFVGLLRRLREIGESGQSFESEGFRNLFRALSEELGDDYLAGVEEQLRRLDPARGVLMTSRLGDGNVGTSYVLRRPRSRRVIDRIRNDPGHAFSIDPRDDADVEALGQLRGQGHALAAAALCRSADHILAFFSGLRFELGFYVACLNLLEKLAAAGMATCMPEPVAGGIELTARCLCDPVLALGGVAAVAGSDADLRGKVLVMITGANHGGKSTFLRAVGIAQLMMQAGAFVAAESFRADLRSAVFTHYRRRENPAMTQGKLDEELARAGCMVEALGPGALVLFNESFASTNEREGSQIARELVRALVDAGVKVIFVTHLYDLAHSLWVENRPDAAFLRAERLADGTRTFRLVPGEPLSTSHGLDVYRRVFGETSVQAPG
jgi:hypothetical protein